MLKNRYITVVILLISIIFTSNAQSPYTMYGFGSLDDCTLGINSVLVKEFIDNISNDAITN